MKKFVTAVQDTEGEDEDRGVPIEFDLDGREMKAYRPHEGQLTFMLAALGRGQTDDQRYAAIVNIMMSSLKGDDQDHLESRLLSNSRKERLRLKQLEEIFEYLISEWFADPTQSPSDSAESEPSALQKSPPATT
ncbi:hypothetical protein [Aeromicrobium sp.]|uniref:hypothetical protein n=1 Tax=Aeromicrobium sp. TaxID=1871063 RepID=UPI001995B80F|nr:hypothetical protein [Aeromicrobium sp.]MBC7630405.1 hypothetical protein [Aeromicrobium sp.]